MAKRTHSVQTVDPSSPTTVHVHTVSKTTAGQVFKYILLGMGVLLMAGVGGSKNAGAILVVALAIVIAVLFQYNRNPSSVIRRKPGR